MKIYIIHATSFEFSTELYQPIKASTLFSEHEFVFPHEAKEANSKRTIQGCDLVIAEVSHPSTGSGIELGWANVFDIPILCLHKSEKKPSSSLRQVTEHILCYERHADIPSLIDSWLAKHLCQKSYLHTNTH